MLMDEPASVLDDPAAFLTGGEFAEYDDVDAIFENSESQRVADDSTGRFG
jgi:phosphate transport system ATP-binding protein